jgi:hypothetical protein
MMEQHEKSWKTQHMASLGSGTYTMMLLMGMWMSFTK